MADTTIDLLKNSSYVGKMDELIAAVKLGGSATSDVEWNNVKNKPTTIVGYGITDAKIENGTITLGNQTITPLTSAPVTSVNSKTGVVVLTANDVGALPNTTTIPDKTSQLDNDSGYITNSALTDYAKKTEIPTALPNPTALTFTGAVTGTYDGSEPVEINIPSGGGAGGSGKAKTQKLIDITFSEPTASLSVTLEHNFHKLFLVWHCGEGGASRIVDANGNAASGKLGVCLDTTSFTWNDRKIAQMDANTSMWKTTASLIEYTDDLSTLLQSAVFEISTGSSGNIANNFGGYLAMIGTIGKDAMAPTAGRTVNIVTSTGFFATTTRIVLVGEYYE